MALNAGIEIPGLAAFRRDLKKIDDDLPKQLRDELVVVGKEVAGDAQRRVPSRSGKAAGSIRAGVSGNNAYVAGGKKSVPYYGWLDFGSRTPRSGRPRSVGPWKGSGGGPKQGRFIYAAIAENREHITKRAQQAFDKVADEALKRTY